MNQRHDTYYSCLLRIWMEQDQPLRIGVVETQSGRQHGFASLDDFIEFLNRRSSGQRGGVSEQSIAHNQE